MQDLSLIRNISIIAHIDAGKTSTSEGMLYFTGRTHRIGSIDEGTTVLDYLPEERERGITIVSAAATMPWHDHLIHLIDTPGHIDFTAEVERSLRVIDGAIVIFSGVEGVEAQSEKVWHQADRYHVPRLAFINKLDRLGADFTRVLDEINHKFDNCAVAVQIPVGIENDFQAVIDLLGMELLRFSDENNETVERLPIPPDLEPEAQLRREVLLERLADASDEIAQLYLDGQPIPTPLLQQTLRRLVLQHKLVPVFCGSAKKRIGIQPLLDAVLHYLPSPLDVPPVTGQRLKDDTPVEAHPDETEPFAGLIFKLIAGASADLIFLRTYCGTLKSGMTLVNSRTKEKVRIKQILRLFAKSTEAVESVGPGDIVGIIGPQGCGTGDTLAEMNRTLAFEKIQFPDPVISIAVEPKLSRDKEKLDQALALLCREDPTLALSHDHDTGQRLFSGMGELHLEVNINRLPREFKVEAKVGSPRVAYRETLTGDAEIAATFQKMIGETELFAGLTVRFHPLPRGDQFFRIENKLRGRQEFPKGFVEAAEKALQDGLKTGGARGYPLIYVAAELRGLATDPARTTEPAVVGAALQAVGLAIRQIGTTVLEPVMHLEVTTPDDCIGEITGFLQPRRAVIHEMLALPNGKRILCEVPLAEMFGFGKALPKLSGGRASFSMEPCGYQEIPPEIAQRMFGEFAFAPPPRPAGAPPA
ncbi:MAG: elongation factor G [Lentisphaeria bacterium]|jgi:elongation factor G